MIFWCTRCLLERNGAVKKTNFDEESENKPRETVHSLEFTVADKTIFFEYPKYYKWTLS